MWLPWQIALAMAAVLAAAGLLCHPTRRVLVGAAAFARETAIVLGLYVVWRIAGTLSVMQVNGAMARGRAIWNLEQALRFPSELAIQKALLPHPSIVQAANLYYAIVHVPALLIFLVWLFGFHRDQYVPWRNTIAFLTASCLLIQLVPVAPPRLMPELGFVDTATRYGQSVYTAVGTGASDQLSAMPSVHVGWAVVVGLAVVLVGKSRWRWLVLAHPVLTMAAVVITANHWWLDGVVAVALLAASLLAALAIQEWRQSRQWRRAAEEAPVPVLTAAE